MSPIANTILSQLGGNRFIAMTGARDFVFSGNSLSFRLPANFARDGITHVTIRLDPSDTYSVEFKRLRGLNITDKGSVSDVYAETLRTVFTERTGLHCTL